MTTPDQPTADPDLDHLLAESDAAPPVAGWPLTEAEHETFLDGLRQAMLSELRDGSNTVALADLLATYAPGSHPPPWTWDDEERDIMARECVCCGQLGHYQAQLEAHIATHGMDGLGVCLGNDGRIWDGHHRIVAARRLRIERVPVESWEASKERFRQDRGRVGDRRRTGNAAPALRQDLATYADQHAGGARQSERP